MREALEVFCSVAYRFEMILLQRLRSSTAKPLQRCCLGLAVLLRSLGSKLKVNSGGNKLMCVADAKTQSRSASLIVLCSTLYFLAPR